MYPYDIFLGLDLYQICIAVGFFLALYYLRLWGDTRKFPARLQNLCIAGAVVAVIVGAGSAIVMQGFYNHLAGGAFQISRSTGATFYGGLIGGALAFLAVYFIGGHYLLPKGLAGERFFEMSEIAAGSIAIAHAFGRFGCLFAGCCHGQVTDAWFGVYHVRLDAKVVPVQLYEAIFLLLLFGYLTFRLSKGKHANLAIYLSSYAVWRFFAEYLRADDRGQTVIPFLSPSQLTALLLFALGIGLVFLERFLRQKQTCVQEGSEHEP
ncbi:MAG: prolipoprotein diacylglyceryl transferase [Clostridia bacterium]|nr:prolipoprotein diacylglyceryl transferase [Clostridia bacterium]